MTEHQLSLSLAMVAIWGLAAGFMIRSKYLAGAVSVLGTLVIHVVVRTWG